MTTLFLGRLDFGDKAFSISTALTMHYYRSSIALPLASCQSLCMHHVEAVIGQERLYLVFLTFCILSKVSYTYLINEALIRQVTYVYNIPETLSKS